MKLSITLNSQDLKELCNPEKILDRHGLGPMGPVQKYIDAEVIRQCEPYVPFDNGTLSRSANLATDIGSGLVVYDTPYARYQYYGEVYGPNIPMVIGGEETFRSIPGQRKTPTGKKLQYNTEVHPQAGSFWFERMIADHKDDILSGAQKVAEATS